MRNIIEFTVQLDSKGFTVENLDKFDGEELAQIMKVLPDAVREVKSEIKRRKIRRKLFTLEAKSVWTARESIFYAAYSPKANAFDTACDRFNLFKEMEVSVK